jgi:formylglycine-generating enzyme required for sulfatase activity
VNYWDSGDPFDNDTAPAGFFGTNGLRLWDDPDFGWPAEPPSSFQVIDAHSYYGLYDLSGNVAEWMQDRYSGLNTRTLRGGSWTSSAAQGVWIRTFDRDYATPTLPWQTIGFRVLRVANAPGE